MRRTRSPGLFQLFFRLAVVLISIGITTEFFEPFPLVVATDTTRVDELQLGSTKPNKVQVCGSHLAVVIKYKCKDQRHRTTGLHSPAIGLLRLNARKYFLNIFNSKIIYKLLDREKTVYPLFLEDTHRPNTISKESRHSFLQRHGGRAEDPDRFKRLPGGVVQECCMRACYESQLLKYCGFGPDFGRGEEIISTTPTPSAEESRAYLSENNIENALRKSSISDTESSVSQEVPDVVPLILEMIWGMQGFNAPLHLTATRFHKHNSNHRDYHLPPSSNPGVRNLRHLNPNRNETIIASALTSIGHLTGFRPRQLSSTSRAMSSDETKRDFIHSIEVPTEVPDFSYNGGAPNQFPFAIPTGTSRDDRLSDTVI